MITETTTETPYETSLTALAPVKSWTRGVAFDAGARAQVERIAMLPFIHRHVAVMPDVHVGIGATVGTVIATRGAIVPAAVGVDIGCGMMAVRTSLRADQLPDDLGPVRAAIEKAVPHGRTDGGRRNDRGAWGRTPRDVDRAWSALGERYRALVDRHPRISHREPERQLGTLGGGNHFVEVCLDEEQRVWVMLHSGSRGAGNRIGSVFIELARRDMERQDVRLPDRDLAYFREGSDHFDAYVEAVAWAQEYAMTNRELMMEATLTALRTQRLPQFTTKDVAVNCHHNYVSREAHFGEDVLVTRKGAVRAGEGELGIIPGSMGARSFIVRGKGNPESFSSCSHGAGRLMSRTEAKKRFSVAEHREATAGVECRKDASVIDETPGAYKPIDAVMAAQADLVSVVHTLKQVVCVKG